MTRYLFTCPISDTPSDQMRLLNSYVYVRGAAATEQEVDLS